MHNTETFTSYLEDEIVIGRYLTAHVDLEIAKNAVAVRKKVAGDKPHPTLIDITSVLYFEPDSKHYLATDESYEYISAGALLVKSVYQKIGGNFYLYIKKQPLPTRIFTDELEAIEWLKKHRT